MPSPKDNSEYNEYQKKTDREIPVVVITV